MTSPNQKNTQTVHLNGTVSNTGLYNTGGNMTNEDNTPEDKSPDCNSSGDDHLDPLGRAQRMWVASANGAKGVRTWPACRPHPDTPTPVRKRPMHANLNTFVDFCKTNRDKMRQTMPALTGNELTAQLLKAWKQTETEHIETMY